MFPATPISSFLSIKNSARRLSSMMAIRLSWGVELMNISCFIPMLARKAGGDSARAGHLSSAVNPQRPSRKTVVFIEEFTNDFKQVPFESRMAELTLARSPDNLVRIRTRHLALVIPKAVYELFGDGACL